MKVRKKPIIYDAWILDSNSNERPDWVNYFMEQDSLQFDVNSKNWRIPTLEGIMIAQEGDVLICGSFPNKIWAVQRAVFDLEYDIITD